MSIDAALAETPLDSDGALTANDAFERQTVNGRESFARERSGYHASDGDDKFPVAPPIQQQSKEMKSLSCLMVLGLVACASTGVVPMDKGTYLIAKKSAQVGFGPPVGAKADVYVEANSFCEKDGKTVETVKLDETPSGFARSASVSLQFRCVAK